MKTKQKLSPYDQAMINMFFLLADIRLKHDLPIIEEYIAKHGKYNNTNEDLNFKGAIIAPYSLITKGYAYSSKSLENRLNVLSDYNKLEELLVSEKVSGLKYHGLLNNDGAIAVTETGDIAAANVLYDGLIKELLSMMIKQGIVNDSTKRDFEKARQILAYNGDGHGSTRRANCLAAAYVSGKKTVCSDQTPYFPDYSFKSLGLPRITLYDGKNGQSAIIFFSDDKKLKEYPLKPAKANIYTVLVSFERDLKKPTALYPAKTFIGPIDDLKTYYIEYLQSKQ